MSSNNSIPSHKIVSSRSGTTGLRDLTLDDSKLNIQNINRKEINNNITVIAKEDINMPSSSTINTKSFNITTSPKPKKDAFLEQLSPLRDHSSHHINTSFNILSTDLSADLSNDHSIDSVIHPSVNEYKKRIHEITDLKIVNEDLIKELELLQDEINHKNQIINIKSMKIDEIMHENNKLLTDLKLERESNENDFNAWLDLKTNLELQIHNLKTKFENQHHEHLDTDGDIDDLLNLSDEKLFNDSTEFNDSNHNHAKTKEEYYNKIQIYKNEVNKLKKKVNALQKENELEVQSKIMIMDELEMMRERYLEVDEKHEFLKLDYDDLVKELLSLRGEDEGDDDDEYNEDENKEDQYDRAKTEDLVVASDLNPPDNDNDRILKIRKKRNTSKSSNNSSEDNSRVASLRNNSLNKAIRDVELKSQKQKYSQELIKYEFEIKSLKLQNEKLLSYIGYTLQMNGIDGIENLKNFSDSNINNNNNNNINLAQYNRPLFGEDRVISSGSTISNKTTTCDNIEYSDAYNIKTAQKNLKTVIKSASAFPIRPDNVLQRQQLPPQTQPISNFKGKQRLVNSASIDFNGATLHTIPAPDDTDSFLDMQSSSIDYSTDYNQGEVQCLDIGGSDSFEEYGDDELDEDELNHSPQKNNTSNNNNNIPITDLNLNILNNQNNQNNQMTEPPSSFKTKLSKNKNIFTSTDSLNVSYKMNFINSNKYNKNRNGDIMETPNNTAKTTITPRAQLKRVTPSCFNLKRNGSSKQEILADLENVDVELNDNNNNKNDNNDIGSKDDVVVEPSDNVIIKDLNLIDGRVNEDEEDYLDIVESDLDMNLNNKILRNNGCGDHGHKHGKSFSMYQISEEDESEADDDDNFKIEFSSSEEEDYDGDEDDTFNISNQEVDMFKIDFLRRLYCPKHSMFQCFCRTMDLVNPLYFKIFSSPIYSLRRKLRRQYQMERKSPSLNTLKLKSKLMTNSNSASSSSFSSLNNTRYPMRYHRHERDIEQLHNNTSFVKNGCCKDEMMKYGNILDDLDTVSNNTGTRSTSITKCVATDDIDDMYVVD